MLSWNLADLIEAVVDVVGDRQAVVSAGARLSYRQLDDRANGLAHGLAAEGIGVGSHVGLALRNGHPYLETLLAAFKLRAIPVNIDTRYTVDELAYLLGDAAPEVVIHEADVAERLGLAAAAAGVDATLLSVSDQEAMATTGRRTRPEIARSGNDRYLLYTGGTTGLPKGVLWRHEDLLFSALGGGNPGGEAVHDPAGVAELAKDNRSRYLLASPFAHGTAQWMALSALLSGATVIVDAAPTFAAERLWDLAEAERASVLVIVGDAFARPLVEALDRRPHRWQLDEVLVVLSGGAVLSASTRNDLLAHLPWSVVVDGYGTSETGGQGQMPYWPGQPDASLPRFHVDEDTAVLDDAGRPAPPGSGIVGRLARRGRVPIGYHRDEAASRETFVVLGGQRWAIPGDLARVEGDGSVTLLGRGSSSINTGGEKVFPEEVEIVLKAHPGVFEAVVVGVPDERFGQRVNALVATREGAAVDLEQLDRHCRRRLAPFKVPRRILLVDAIAHRPSGKADLAWAQDQLMASTQAGYGS